MAQRAPAHAQPRAPLSFIDPCQPTKANVTPVGSEWAHEIKHDGYRIQLHVSGDGVRLYTMSGYDWSDRYPLIVKGREEDQSVGNHCVGLEVEWHTPDYTICSEVDLCGADGCKTLGYLLKCI